jgi:hypothetical protein
MNGQSDKVICGSTEKIDELNENINKLVIDGYSSIGIAMSSFYSNEVCILLSKTGGLHKKKDIT